MSAEHTGSAERLTRHGVEGARPGREAVVGGGRKRRRQEQFTSYYDRPIINAPRWKAHNIAGYLFLGGLAGASSVLGAGAHLTGRPALARAAKATAFAAIGGSTVALVEDLGRPERFYNMLRVFKPTSPMSVGSWILATYGPLAGAAAATEFTGLFPRVGRLATLGAALTGPAVAAYTGVLLADTAVPAWHAAHRELPYVFVGSAAAAAGGMGMLAAPVSQAGPARRAALFGAAVETAALEVSQRRMGMVAGAYREGRAGRLLTASKWLTIGGALLGAVAGGRSRVAAAVAGAALVAGSACTRFGVFEAGMVSARDPSYTVVPQRERLAHRAADG
jgi:formate-dependent nitrite reductase membrane component NrfD